jgi:uncharacterized protein YndB with AHSA1/START domain
MTDHIEKTIDIKAPVERVWRAITDPAEFGEWFRVKLDGGFAPGENTSGHMTYPGYEHLKWEVKVVQMRRPELFSYEWHPFAIDPSVDYADEPPTLVEFHLAPTPDGTRLTITETGFENIPAHRMPEALIRNEGGWAQQVLNVKAHVER